MQNLYDFQRLKVLLLLPLERSCGTPEANLQRGTRLDAVTSAGFFMSGHRPRLTSSIMLPADSKRDRENDGGGSSSTRRPVRPTRNEDHAANGFGELMCPPRIISSPPSLPLGVTPFHPNALQTDVPSREWSSRNAGALETSALPARGLLFPNAVGSGNGLTASVAWPQACQGYTLSL